jgi:hypothetical protein
MFILDYQLKSKVQSFILKHTMIFSKIFAEDNKQFKSKYVSKFDGVMV